MSIQSNLIENSTIIIPRLIVHGGHSMSPLQNICQPQYGDRETRHHPLDKKCSDYIMGIDQSFNSCGVVIIDGDGKVIESQIFRSNKTLSDFERSWQIFREIYSVVCKYSIEKIAIEGLAFAKCGNATRSLAILQGVLVTNLLYLRNLDDCVNTVKKVEIITPSCLKKFGTGKGKATKRMMIEKVPVDIVDVWKKKWSLKTIEDLADAYFLANYLKMKLA